MDGETIKVENARIKGKQVNKLPKGAEVLKKEVDTTVEEIENGFIVEKRYEIKYQLNKQIDWMHYSKKVYSKENPIKISEDKMLADFFD